jgi:hypothetical protein
MFEEKSSEVDVMEWVRPDVFKLETFKDSEPGPGSGPAAPVTTVRSEASWSHEAARVGDEWDVTIVQTDGSAKITQVSQKVRRK